MQASQSLEARRRGIGGFARQLLNVPELGVSVAVVVFFLVFTALDSSMASPDNLARILTLASYIGLVGLGMSALMLAGEIDLSAGFMAGLAAAVASALIKQVGWPEWAGILAACGTAVMVGLFNSFVALVIGMPSFFTTLSSGFIVYGLTWLITQGQWISTLKVTPFLYSMTAPTPLFGLPGSVLVYLGLVIVGDLLVRLSKVGPILSATGGNRRAADVSGINTARVKTLCFILVSLCAAWAGMFLMTASNASDPALGYDWQLWVITIAIIGGASFSGGVGTVLGAFLATILVTVIKLGLANAHVQTNAQSTVVGAVLIAAALMDVARRRAKKY
jgi:ribose transport system permease protein